jgi:putative oxidoreductase
MRPDRLTRPILAEGVRRLAVPLGRIAIAALFLHEAWFKLTHYAPSGTYMARFGVPSALLPAALAVELAGGLALISGVMVREAAAVLAVFCVAAAVLFHGNWADHNQLLHFQKDVAIAGGLVILAACRHAGRPASP